MEDTFLSGASRRSRPESSSSTTTKMTPPTTTISSSNGSIHHVSTRGNNARGSSGTSLLQERLRERKVESAKANKRKSMDMSGDRGGIQSSPIKGSREREERRPSSSGVGAAKGMGVKQIEDVSFRVFEGLGSYGDYLLTYNSKYPHFTSRTSI